MNLRLQELLTCVHASGLGGYALAPDPRVTYWPFGPSLFEKAALGITASQLSGPTDQQLFFAGERVAPPGSGGRLLFKWRLSVTDGSSYQLVEYADGADVVSAVAGSYTLTGGLSGLIPLPGSELRLRFTAGTGAVWLIETLARPGRGLAELAADLDLAVGDAARRALFPPGCPEPYRTFGNLWDLHDQLPFRLAGLTLALGYRLDELTE